MSNPGPELFKAMLAFQSTNPRVDKWGNNPHFRSKYITLEDLTSVARACNKHGLVFWHHQVDEDGVSYEVTTLAHAESGQCIETRVKLLFGKNDSQGQGSAKTYARCYGLAGLFALCDTKDDDGIGAMESTGRAFVKDERTGKGSWSAPAEKSEVFDDVPFDSGVTDDLRTPEEKARLEEEERKAKHHPSWQENRGRFCAIISMELDIDYYELCKFLESKGLPRPSGMDERRRSRTLDNLRTEAGRNAFLNWKEER